MYLRQKNPSYLWWDSWSRGVGSQAWWHICDVGLLGAWRLVCLSGGQLRSPGAQAAHLWHSWMVLFLICTMRHWREAGLRWSIGKVGTFGLSGHVLHLCRAANGLLPIMGPTWYLMLGARLGRSHLDIKGGLTWGWGCSIGSWDRLRSGMALRLGHRADRGRGDRRDSPRSLRFGHSLLSSSQRRLGWNDHALITSHRSTRGGGCRGPRILKTAEKFGSS